MLVLPKPIGHVNVFTVIPSYPILFPMQPLPKDDPDYLERRRQSIVRQLSLYVKQFWEMTGKPVPMHACTRRYARPCGVIGWTLHEAAEYLVLKGEIHIQCSAIGAFYYYPKYVWDEFDEGARALQIEILNSKFGRPRRKRSNPMYDKPYVQPKSIEELDNE